MSPQQTAGWRSTVFRSLAQFEVLNLLPVPEVVWIGDWKAGRRKWYWVSDAACTKLNQPRDELLNMKLDTGHSQSMYDHMQEVHAKVQCAGEEFSLIKTVHPAGKPCHWLQTFRPIRVHLPQWEEERTLFMLETRDVDEAHKANGKSTEWERLSLGSALLEYSESITMMFDAESEDLNFANQRATTFYETALESGGRELQSLSDVFSRVVWESEEQKQTIIKSVRSLKLESHRIEVEGRMSRAAGGGPEEGEVWHHLIFIPSLNPVNSRASIIVNQREISKLKAAQEDLRAANAAREVAFASISHELKTPVHGIKGLVEAALDSRDCPPRVRQQLHIVRTCAQRLACLVNDILDMAASQQASLTIRSEERDMAELVANVVDVVTPLLRKGVRLVTGESLHSLPAVQCDGDRIQQVLMNLLNNAVKFTEEGQITVAAWQEGPAGEEVVRVSVSDTGIGIQPDRAHAIWGAFKQADAATTRKFGGTGLGLMLVKTLVEAHGGTVGLRSETSGRARGTTFSFTLPVRGNGVASCTLQQAQQAEIEGGQLGKGGGQPEGDVRKHLEELEGALREGRERERALQDKLRESRRRPEGWGEGAEREEGRERWERLRGRGCWAGYWQQPSESGAARRLQGFHVLSVDDDGVNQMVIQNMLAPLGCAVTTCMDGASALRRLRLPVPEGGGGGSGKEEESTGTKEEEEEEEEEESEWRMPDLVLLDNMMPGMTGLEVVRAIRQRYSAAELPVIMLSARQSVLAGREDCIRGDGSIEEALMEGCSDFIGKPFPRADLLARLSLQFALQHEWRSILASKGSSLDAPAAAEAHPVPCRGSPSPSSPAGGPAAAETGVQAPATVHEGAHRLKRLPGPPVEGGGAAVARGAEEAAQRQGFDGQSGRGEGRRPAGEGPKQQPALLTSVCAGGSRAIAEVEVELVQQQLERERRAWEEERAERDDEARLLAAQRQALERRLQRREAALGRAEEESLRLLRAAAMAVSSSSAPLSHSAMPQLLRTSL